jgi:hypothetical protein
MHVDLTDFDVPTRAQAKAAPFQKLMELCQIT